MRPQTSWPQAIEEVLLLVHQTISCSHSALPFEAPPFRSSHYRGTAVFACAFGLSATTCGPVRFLRWRAFAPSLPLSSPVKVLTPRILPSVYVPAGYSRPIVKKTLLFRARCLTFTRSSGSEERWILSGNRGIGNFVLCLVLCSNPCIDGPLPSRKRNFVFRGSRDSIWERSGIC